MAKLVPTDFQVTEDGQYYIHDKRNQHGVVLNAVKFKLVLRMFSVVKSGMPYKVMKY